MRYSSASAPPYPGAGNSLPLASAGLGRLQQWHNTHDPDYGMGVGDYFAGFLVENCRALELITEEADKARFEGWKPFRLPITLQAKEKFFVELELISEELAAEMGIYLFSKQELWDLKVAREYFLSHPEILVVNEPGSLAAELAIDFSPGWEEDEPPAEVTSVVSVVGKVSVVPLVPAAFVVPVL